MCCPVARRLFVFLLAAGLVGALSCSAKREAPDEDDSDLGAVGAFTLKERGGQTVSADDLKGKVWVASFIFTRCSTGCPQVTGTMARLQKELDLAGKTDLRLVTLTVDPERDNPAELKEYAKRYAADPEKWLFLTGDKDKIHEIIQKQFKVHVAEREGEERKPGNEFDHSTRLVLVDKRGHVRGYFSGMPSEGEDEKAFEAGLAKLRKRVAKLLREDR